MADAAVLVERREQVYLLTVNRPEQRNALDRAVIEGLREGLRRAQCDPEARAIVLTGAGDRAFCAGADLRPGKAFELDPSKPALDYAELLRHARSLTLPLVVRVNGACLAGGMGLLCMGDMAVAADTAVFGLPEVKVGVFPMQVLSLLQGLVPRRIVAEWCITGEVFDAQAALRHGLVNYCVPYAELDDKVQWLLDRIVHKSPTAIRRGKYAMRAMAAMSFEESLAYAEGQIASLAMTQDALEGMRAFNQKRKPVWTGK